MPPEVICGFQIVQRTVSEEGVHDQTPLSFILSSTCVTNYTMCPHGAAPSPRLQPAHTQCVAAPVYGPSEFILSTGRQTDKIRLSQERPMVC
jgi:hypothetical protein